MEKDMNVVVVSQKFKQSAIKKEGQGKCQPPPPILGEGEKIPALVIAARRDAWEIFEKDESFSVLCP